MVKRRKAHLFIGFLTNQPTNQLAKQSGRQNECGP